MPVFSKPLEAVRGAKPEDVRKCFFEEVYEYKVVDGKQVKKSTGTFKCKLCNLYGKGKKMFILSKCNVSLIILQLSSTDARLIKGCNGSTNLVKHLTETKLHAGQWVDRLRAFVAQNKNGSKGIMSWLETCSKRAKAIYAWMVLIIEENLPFDIVAKEAFRQFSESNETICVQTLLNYFHRLGEHMVEEIGGVLKDKQIIIMIDDWSTGAIHYGGLYAYYYDPEAKAMAKELLAISPLSDGFSADQRLHADGVMYGADVHAKWITAVLLQYGLSWLNVAGITGDTCSVNKALARGQRRPAIGCYNHKLHLAVTVILSLDKYSVILEATSDYMNTLSQLKNGEVLRQYTKLLPRRMYKNRWSGVNTTLMRLKELQPVVGAHLAEFSAELRNLHDSLDEHMEAIDGLLVAMADFNEVSLVLQRRETTLAEARGFFGKLNDKYANSDFIPDLDLLTKFSEHLTKVYSPDFEKAIVKVQTGEEATLTEAEAATIRVFLKSELLPSNSTSANSTSITASVVADLALKRALMHLGTST